jgi:hypothetical protein
LQPKPNPVRKAYATFAMARKRRQDEAARAAIVAAAVRVVTCAGASLRL